MADLSRPLASDPLVVDLGKLRTDLSQFHLASDAHVSWCSLCAARRQAALAPLLARLDEIAAEPDDWDGDGAVAPALVAVDNARRVVLSAASLGLPLETVTVEPDANGGVAVALSWPVPPDDASKQAWVDCRNDGYISALLGEKPDGGSWGVCGHSQLASLSLVEIRDFFVDDGRGS